jgi:hypothetical protein
MIGFSRFLVAFSKIALPLFALYMGVFHSAHVAKHASILMHVIPLVVLMVVLEIIVLRHDTMNSPEAD